MATMNDAAPWSPPKNAVLKLQIGPNSVRRIKIHLLLDDDGHLSYDKLVRWCIRYSPLFIAKKHEKKVGSSSLESVLRKWEVKVTYVDDEGDLVLLGSTDEFIDAFQQAEQARLATRPPVEIGSSALSAKNWTSNGSVSSTASSSQTGVPPKSMVVLKCQAEVHEKSSRDENEEETAPTSEDTSSAPSSVVEDADTTMAPPKSSPSEAPRKAASAGNDTTGPDRRRRGAQPQVQALLESFVSILATAVMALQDHLAAVSANARAIDEIQSGRAKTCLRREQQQGTGGVASDASVDPEKEESTSEDDAPALQVAARLVKEAMKQKTAADEEKNEVPTAPPSEVDEEKKEDEVPAGFDPNFVHVRHTCDGCMQNPIVGIRYHATNIPDYDLCQGCMNNFTGKDILFEPEELERDRRFQFRARRHIQRGQRSMRGCPAGGRRPGFPGGFRGRRAHCPGGRHHHHRHHQDSELKEAIRRSLIDVQSKGKATASETEGTKATKAETSKVDDVATDTTDSSVASAEEVLSEVPEVLASAAPAPAPAPPKMSSAQAQAQAHAQDEIEENVAKVVDAVGFTIEQCALVINAVVSEFVDGGSSKKGAQSVPAVATPAQAQRATAAVAASDSKGASDGSKGDDNLSSVTDPEFPVAEDPKSDAISVEMKIQDERVPVNADLQDNEVENANAENETPQPPPENEGEMEEAFFDTFATDGVDDKPHDEESADVEREAFHSLVSEKAAVDDASDVAVDAVEPEAEVEQEASNVDAGEEVIAEEEEKSPEVSEVALANGDDGIKVIDSVGAEEGYVKPESPEDEWNIVDSGENLDSQNLARAAEALGSALFQEDISRSAESLKANVVDVSEVEGGMSKSSSSISLSSSVSMVSSVSSVTSSVSSVESSVPAVSSGPALSDDVLANWGDLIGRLREMGFTDDVKSADVLETLRASGEDVTIDAAVTYLVNN